MSNTKRFSHAIGASHTDQEPNIPFLKRFTRAINTGKPTFRRSFSAHTFLRHVVVIVSALALMTLSVPAQALAAANEDKPYVVARMVAPSEYELTFQYGSTPTGTDIAQYWEIADTYATTPPWEILMPKKIIIDSSFANYRPVSTSYWFSGSYYLLEIQNGKYIKSNEPINVKNMFTNCGLLEAVDVSGLQWNEGGCQDVFWNCSSLKEVTFSNCSYMSTLMNFPHLSGTTTSFWRGDMNEAINYDIGNKEQAKDAFNEAFAKIPDNQSKTFSLASMRLTYDANGGEFEANSSAQNADDTGLNYLYGNPNESIGENTPVPVREGYRCIGYATDPNADTPDTPTAFPDTTADPSASTTFYAVWEPVPDPGPTPPDPEPTPPSPTPDPTPAPTPGTLPVSDTNLLPSAGDSAATMLLVAQALAGVALLGIAYNLKRQRNRN